MTPLADRSLAIRLFFSLVICIFIAVFLYSFWWWQQNIIIAIGTGIISSTAVASLIPTATQKWLWHRRYINWILGYPDLRGRWEGWTKGELTEPFRIAIEYRQEGKQISAKAWSASGARAIGITSPIFVERDDTILIYPFEAFRTDTSDSNATHRGIHWLRLTRSHGKKMLEGRYISDGSRNDNTRGHSGVIRIGWVSLGYKEELAYIEGHPWGIENSDRGM